MGRRQAVEPVTGTSGEKGKQAESRTCGRGREKEESMSSQPLQGLYRPGWLTFAAIVLFSVGCLRVISAIYYFADSARVNNLNLGAFGHHLFLWASGT
jgi:hypothetical protein